MIEKQSKKRRRRHKIGTMIARSEVTTDPTISAVETRGFPIPPVRAEDLVRSAIVTPWNNAAAPPPAIMANVHFRKGESSITMDAVAIVPATMAAGDVIRSSK
jgi:hypothetical protein